MVYEVYKKISKGRDEKGAEIFWATGTLVESGNWKNERSLIEQGYLGPPRKSQTEINKFLSTNTNKDTKIAKTSKVVGVKRPPMAPGLVPVKI